MSEAALFPIQPGSAPRRCVRSGRGRSRRSDHDVEHPELFALHDNAGEAACGAIHGKDVCHCCVVPIRAFDLDRNAVDNERSTVDAHEFPRRAQSLIDYLSGIPDLEVNLLDRATAGGTADDCGQLRGEGNFVHAHAIYPCRDGCRCLDRGGVAFHRSRRDEVPTIVPGSPLRESCRGWCRARYPERLWALSGGG